MKRIRHKEKPLTGLISALLLISAGAVSAQDVTVKTAPVREENVFHQIFYGTRLEPASRVPQRAPIPGIVEEIQVETGERVSPGTVLCTIRRDLSSRNYKAVELTSDSYGIIGRNDLKSGAPVQESQELFTVLKTDTLKGTIFLSDLDADAIRRGDRCEIFQGKEPTGITGRFELIYPEPDYSTGLFEAVFTIPGDSGVETGSFVKIEIRKNPYSGLVVPARHIVRKYGKDHLYIVKDGVVELREVKLGERYGEVAALIDGVSEGELFVTGSSGRIDEGMKVTVEE